MTGVEEASFTHDLGRILVPVNLTEPTFTDAVRLIHSNVQTLASKRSNNGLDHLRWRARGECLGGASQSFVDPPFR